MTGFEQLAAHIDRHIQLTAEERDFLFTLLRERTVRKKQNIVQPDFVCRYRSYIIKGVMRAYLVDDKGQDHTLAFSIEDWWISDYNSYIYQRPATLFVEALEETTVVELDYNAEQLLLQTHPKFERFFRIITQRALASYLGFTTEFLSKIRARRAKKS